MEDKEKIELEAEIGRHMMQPENYGKLEGADGVGFGVDKATNSYVVFYLKIEEDIISNVMYGTNSSEDAVTLGSLLTEMIKGESVANALAEVTKLEKDLQDAYDLVEAPKVDTTKPEGEQVERISTESQDSANMVLTSFRAAMRHYERKLEGIQEDHFEMSIVKTCPYSLSDCHFVEKADS